MPMYFKISSPAEVISHFHEICPNMKNNVPCFHRLLINSTPSQKPFFDLLLISNN